MLLDFGFIEEFNNSTNTGKISQTMLNSGKRRGQVTFSGSQITNRELITRLEKNSIRGVRVWYSYESEGTVERIESLWYQPSEMLPNICEQYIKNLEKFWFDIDSPKPSWLDSVTKALGGIDLHTQMSQERSRMDGKRKLEQMEAEKIEIARLDEQRRDYERRREEIRLADAQREYQEKLGLTKSRKKQERLVWTPREDDIEHRASEIQQFCEEREIEHLFHFTHVSNLVGILEKGLISRESLRVTDPEGAVHFNDQKRLDGFPNANSLSIGFPNYSMFNKYAHANRAEWVVIDIDASVLWHFDCAFNSENAASIHMREISIKQRKSISALKSMFDDQVFDHPRTSGIPKFYPTNPQAEVLVFDTIPPNQIQSVYFHNTTAKLMWKANNQNLFRNGFMENGYYFLPRTDYADWSKNDNFSPTIDWFDEENSFLNEPSRDELFFGDPEYWTQG